MKRIIAAALFLVPIAARADDCDNASWRILHRTDASYERLDASTAEVIGSRFSMRITCHGLVPAAIVSTLEGPLPAGFFELVGNAGNAISDAPVEEMSAEAELCWRKAAKSKDQSAFVGGASANIGCKRSGSFTVTSTHESLDPPKP